MTDINWGPQRPHDGSAECPAEALNVQCMLLDHAGRKYGKDGWKVGREWAWGPLVYAYCLRATARDAGVTIQAVKYALGVE